MKTIKWLAPSLGLIFSISAFANGPALTTTANEKHMMWCCAVNEVTVQQAFNDTSQGPAHHENDGCTIAGSHGSAHDSYSNGIVTDIFAQHVKSHMDVGTRCAQVIIHRHCEWAYSDSTICASDTVNAAGPLKKGANPDSGIAVDGTVS